MVAQAFSGLNIKHYVEKIIFSLLRPSDLPTSQVFKEWDELYFFFLDWSKLNLVIKHDAYLLTFSTFFNIFIIWICI